MGSLIFYLHYTLLTSGLSGTSVLLGIFFRTYSDASQAEIGLLLMSFPFVSIIIKPLFCSMADRFLAHRLALILSLLTLLIGYTPFIVIPFYPEFYEKFPRASWYVLVVACHIGNAGLGVGWSLGDALAINISQKIKTPYSRMRLMGTVSWGFYGYVIGQINESPCLPKFVPAFIILHISVILEIILLILWNKEDFEMYDSSQERARTNEITSKGSIAALEVDKFKSGHLDDNVESSPSSLGGTLRFNTQTASNLRKLMMTEDLANRLHSLKAQDGGEGLPDEKGAKAAVVCESGASTDAKNEKRGKNAQMVMFTMLVKADGRLAKYLLLYTLFGFFMAAMNFVFLSIQGLSEERGSNFSKLAGSMLISQASIETLSFLIVPWFMARVDRSSAMSFSFLVMACRFFFYIFFYSYSEIDPYWAIVGECLHGVAYGIVCTYMAEIALMFANQSKLFIPELRRMGLLSERREDNKAQVDIEENKIGMALRATMQSLFSGFMDGLGSGAGSLFIGLFVEAFSYIKLWQFFTALSLITVVIHQIVECSPCRWSDTYKPKPGSKSFEILSLEKQEKELKIKMKADRKNTTKDEVRA